MCCVWCRNSQVNLGARTLLSSVRSYRRPRPQRGRKYSQSWVETEGTGRSESTSTSVQTTLAPLTPHREAVGAKRIVEAGSPGPGVDSPRHCVAVAVVTGDVGAHGATVFLITRLIFISMISETVHAESLRGLGVGCDHEMAHSYSASPQRTSS
ncbi:MAG: hypothetical protein J07HQW1_03446 [Haloquadratum walsbyi J07HQW1]|uniref:Uncharacterized protein n=1 Tax=Haloquadratum walsbyi J07HQW1 TaxID=1238424 RepID=U1N9G1_9EURY|nr:MAG: hypothetical protein J07HQW1_03446 [Haloquadratum walsbyi J07HQW1]